MIQRTATAALLATLALAAPAAARADVLAPLEVHPAQGPAGSSAVLFAPGLKGGEQVRVVVDGETRAPARTYGDGTLAVTVAMPAGAGVHRVAVQGLASGRKAGGAFTTMADGPPRPALVAAPRPLAAGPNPSRPWLADLLAVNFAPSTELTLRCPCQDDGYATFDFGRTDASGDTRGSFDFDISDYGVIDLGLSEGPGLAPPVLGADAVMRRSPAYDAARRVRVVPPVGATSGRMYVVASGFPPGARVEVDEDGAAAGAVTADADGGLVAFDDDGPPADNPTTATRLTSGGVFGAAASARSAAAVQPVAGVTRDVVAPGAATRVVAAGLPRSAPVAILGLDAAGGQFVLATATSRADGAMDPVTVTLPPGAPAGPYRIEVDAGDRLAFATLAVDGDVDPSAATAPKPTRGAGSVRARIGLRVRRRIAVRRLLRPGAVARLDLRGLACAPSCAVGAQLLRGRRLVGTRTAQVHGLRARIAVRATRRAAARLRRRGSAHLVLRVTVVDPRARRATARRRITVRGS